MLENKRKSVLIAVGLLIICFFVIGVSYAVWSLTFTQTDSNVVTTGCFKVEFTDQNPITLDKAYPMSDEEGKSLTPYEFTLTNTCDSEATYYINLETITSAAKKLSEEYLKVNLKKGENEVFSSTLNSSYINLDKVLSETSNAYKLYQGKLKAKEVTTFYLNLWLDENTPATDEVMNATYEGKVTIATSYKAPPSTKNMMIAMETEEREVSDYNDVGISFTNKTYEHYDEQDDSYYSLSKVVFQSKINPYEEAVEVVDFSAAQDESILGYYVKDESENESEEKYTLYIQADGKIKVNPKASYYFVTSFNTHYLHSYESAPFEGMENLDTSLVTDMSYMFAYYSSKTIDLNWLDTSKVTNMNHMFFEMGYLTSLNLSGLDTENVTDMSYMFAGMYNLTNLDITMLNTRNVTNMSHMFENINGLTSLDLSSFDTRNVTDMERMFYNVNNLATIDLNALDTGKVTTMRSMFGSCEKLTSLDLSSFDTKNVTDMNSMFKDINSLTSLDISHFDTQNVTDMESMFWGMESLTDLNLSHFNTQNVTNMSSMFRGMNKLTSLNLKDLNTSKVTNMSSMFRNLSSLTSLDLSQFDTQNVTNMNYMFAEMSSLTSLDLSNLDTSNVTDMSYMFAEMSNLTSLALSHFDTRNVTNMRSMFSSMVSLTSLDLSSFNTSNVKDMGWMFVGSSKLSSINYGSNFIRKENANISTMYRNCPANKPTHESWNNVFT